jgi:hypothetical protein
MPPTSNFFSTKTDFMWPANQFEFDMLGSQFCIRHFLLHSISGMHNIRPAGKMWPTKPKILFIQLVSFIKTPFNLLKICHFWPSSMQKKFFFCPPRELSCAPLLYITAKKLIIKLKIKFVIWHLGF